LASYARALALGASGIEATAWTTADDVVVLQDRESLGGTLRRRPIRKVVSASLPAGVATLPELYAACGFDFALALEVADESAAGAVIDTARTAGGDAAVAKLWLTHPEWERLGEWRERWHRVRLVNRATVRGLRQGPERRAAQLSAAGIDAVLLHQSEWTGGLTTLFHRFGRLAFASDARYDRTRRDLLRMGIDGMSTDQVERLLGGTGPGET
jgi:glycerophosphoryl diester phosphodiesterase